MTAMRWTRRGSIGACVFELLIVAFAGIIVVSSFGLRSGANLVPLVIGVPTLGMALLQLVLDLRPRPEEQPAPMPVERAPVDAEASIGELVAAAAREQAEDLQFDTSPEAKRRQVLFAGWVIALIVVAELTSFYVAVIGGLALLFWAIRLRPIIAGAIIIGAVATLYGLFDQFLGVRF